MISFKYYTVWNQIHVKGFYVQVWYKCENGLQKELYIEKTDFFSVDYVKINEFMLCTHDVTCNLSRWNNGGTYIYKKGQ